GLVHAHLKFLRKRTATKRSSNPSHRHRSQGSAVMKVQSLVFLGALLGAHAVTSMAQESAAEAVSFTGASHGHGPYSRDDATTDLFRVTGKNAIWTPVSSVATNFTTFHTQGLVKIGDTFYVTAVEILENTVRNTVDTDALYDFSIDRSTGAGRGWLFK